MGHEVKIEKSDSELSAKFRSTIVKGLEDLLKSAQELDLDKIENVKYITDASHDVTETITSRHRLMNQIKREAESLAEIEESQKGRTTKRDTKSLVAAAGTDEKTVQVDLNVPLIKERLNVDPRLQFRSKFNSFQIKYSTSNHQWTLLDRICEFVDTESEVYKYIAAINELKNTDTWLLLQFDGIDYFVRGEQGSLTVLHPSDVNPLAREKPVFDYEHPAKEALENDANLKFKSVIPAGQINYSQLDKTWKFRDCSLTLCSDESEIVRCIRATRPLSNTLGWLVLCFKDKDYFVRDGGFLTVLEAPVANESA